MTEDPFVAHRGLLFTVCYEMLGSATDAEDVVQDTWLRWEAIGGDARAAVRDPRAFLVRMVTRKALDRMRSNARRREEYFGEWLPEPLLTAPDVADDAELAESVSIAMLTVLETLTPTERAVFVLREVFDTPYGEIAEVVGKSAGAVRQIGHRAREHVAARRPRMEVSRGEQQEVVERFLAAVTRGDMQGLLDVLAPDVVLVADGGGVVQAVVNPVMGAKRGRQPAATIQPARSGGPDPAGVAERRGRSPDRGHRRRLRHCDQLRGRRGPDQPHLRRPQPRKARTDRRGGNDQSVAAQAPIVHVNDKTSSSRELRLVGSIGQRASYRRRLTRDTTNRSVRLATLNGRSSTERPVGPARLHPHIGMCATRSLHRR